VARHVLSESNVNKSTRKRCTLTHTSDIFKLSTKSLRKYYSIREKLDTVGEKYCWALIGRLPHIDTKLNYVVKELLKFFWNENTRTSSNQRDVLKLRKGSNEHEPRVKHFIDMTQTKIYEIFKTEHTQFNLCQRSFQKCKPWYIRICTNCNTCCCRYHVESKYYYDTYKHILCNLHINIFYEWSTILPWNAMREFIHRIMFQRLEGQKYYEKSCLYKTCSRCSRFALLGRCIHESEEHGFGRMTVDMESFKYVTYQVYSLK